MIYRFFVSISEPFTNREQGDETKRLLAHNPVVRGACELDLLVFLHRHPRSLLTSEQLAAFAGYDMKQVAKALDVSCSPERRLKRAKETRPDGPRE